MKTRSSIMRSRWQSTGKSGTGRAPQSILPQLDRCIRFSAGMKRLMRSLEESLKIGIEIGAPESLWRALCELGKAGAKLGKDLEAVSHYEKAIDTIEAMRAGLSEKEAKIIFMSGKIFVYDELIELYEKMHARGPVQRLRQKGPGNI